LGLLGTQATAGNVPRKWDLSSEEVHLDLFFAAVQGARGEELMTRAFIVLMAAAALAGCASLTAEAPLFTPADQIGPAPLMEGVWIQTSEKCPARNARRRGRLPAACVPAELRRVPDGAWVLRVQDHVDLDPEDTGDGPPRAYRLIIAPATENRTPETYSPLYLVEYQPLEAAEPVKPAYAVVVPVSEMPAREFRVIGVVSCVAILRDGSIEGVAVTRDERGEITSCVASQQRAVREAARRQTIESLGSLLSEPGEGERWLFVRP
jgi:hypothetical protein